MSLVLLVVAICATGLAACGALVLGTLALSRRGRSERAGRESVTVQFRAPFASEPDVLDAVGPEPSIDPVDATDRFAGGPLFGAPAFAEEDPFEGDTVPFIDVEAIGRSAIADL